MALPPRKFGTKHMHAVKLVLFVLFLVFGAGLILWPDHTLGIIGQNKVIFGGLLLLTAYILKPQRLGF